MKAHAFYAHAPISDADNEFLGTEHDVLPTDMLWGDTHDWEYYVEGVHPRASEMADEKYAALVHQPGLAVCRVVIEIPDDVWQAGIEHGKSNLPTYDNPVFLFMDDVEWEHEWIHPAVTVIRQNELSEKYRVSNTARMARINAGARS